MAPKLPYIKRVQDAVDAIGTRNGTKLPDCELPSDAPASNEFRDMFVGNHDAVAELLVSSIVKKHAETRYDNAKAKVMVLFPPIAALTPGATTAYVYDKMSLAARAQKGAARLNRSKVITKLVTDKKMSFDDATAFVDACEDESKPAIYLTPATVHE